MSDYEIYWEKPEMWILTTNLSGFKPSYKNPRYAIYKREPLFYVFGNFYPEVEEEIVKRMIEAGVEITDRDLGDNITYEENAELLWTVRLHEYALFHSNEHNRQVIYHKPSHQFLYPASGQEEQFQTWIDNLISAGVEILDEDPFADD